MSNTKNNDLVVIDEADYTPASVPETVTEEVQLSAETEDEGDEVLENPWIENADGTRTLPLEIPVRFNIKSRNGVLTEKKITELKFRRLSGGDLIAIENVAKSAQSQEVFRRFTGESNLVLTLLDMQDMVNVNALIDDFFPKPRKITKRS